MTDNERGTIFYLPSQVAELLGVTRAEVLQLIKSRKLSAVRLSPRTYRVMDFQLAWFQRSTATARLSTKSDRKDRR